MTDHRALTPSAAIAFLEEAARYFENRPTGGEDRAHWANVYNAENCRLIAEMIAQGMSPEGRERDCGPGPSGLTSPVRQDAP